MSVVALNALMHGGSVVSEDLLEAAEQETTRSLLVIRQAERNDAAPHLEFIAVTVQDCGVGVQ